MWLSETTWFLKKKKSETTCSFLLYKMSYFFYKENWKIFLLKKGIH